MERSELKFLPIILGLTPLLVLYNFSTFVLHARLLLGYWPQGGRDWPKDRWFDLHEHFFIGTIILSPVLLIMVAVSFAWCWYRKIDIAAGLVTFFGTAVATLFTVMIDPGGFIEWFLD